MEVSVLNIQGQETGRKVTLNDAIYAIEPNDHVLYLDVKQYMGNERVTTQNLRVLKVIPESNLLIIKGSVAGCNGSTLLIQK